MQSLIKKPLFLAKYYFRSFITNMNILIDRNYYSYNTKNTNFTGVKKYPPDVIQKIEAQVIELHNKKINPKEISKQLGIGLATLYNIFRKLSLTSDYAIKKAKIKDMPIENITPETIIDILGCKKEIANQIYTKIKEPPRMAKREELAKKIVDLKNQGFSNEEIAKRVNKSISAVRGYLKYAKQTHLDINV